MNIRILPVAQREIDKAAEWYERERDGLGFTFLDRVDQGLDQWRREWDSNPRYLAVHTLSKRAP